MTAVGYSWRMRAACRGLDTSLFFPERGEPVAEAQAVCASCPVRLACGEFALASSQRFGIWGGQSERSRKRIRAERRAGAGVHEVAA